jgi:uncharacterized protein (DUF58 family)
MTNFFKYIFLNTRFFILASAIIVVFAASFAVQWMFPLGISLLILLFAIALADYLLLGNKYRQVIARRKIPNILSLGDENKIRLNVINNTGINVHIDIFEDLPLQLQMRDFKIQTFLKKGEEKAFSYIIEPNCRGKYTFGNINLLISSPIGLLSKKQIVPLKEEVAVFPSIIQMKKYEMKSHTTYTISGGIKRHRRLGHSYEFDQVKEYVIGDDSRSINWKASSRKGTLMVNQYEDERAQQVYSIIDKSRSMRMPFNNLTLLDYSINASLVISNIILQKHDKAGLITFSDKIGTILPAERSSQQLNKIINALYNEQENFLEAQYELMYHLVRNVIKNRSLIFLYTNFESFHAFERILPILRHINKFHLLVVIFFDNEDVVELSKKDAGNLMDIFVQTSARKYLNEKNQIVTELANHGIHAIKTLPKELSINTINKYLELKSRGMI